MRSGDANTVSGRSNVLIPKEGAPTNFQDLVIEGDRIRLKPTSDQYAESIFQEFTLEITRYMFPKPSDSLEGVRKGIEKFRAACQKREEIVFAILNKDTEEFLGCCGIHGRDDGRNPELGLWVKKSGHGNGYGREAIHALVKWARESLEVDSFVYPVAKENIASRKIPESLGGVVFAEKLVTTMRGTVLDEVVYRIKA